MDPMLRPYLVEMHQRELLAEAHERRRAAQVRRPLHLRLRAGSFFLALGEALLGASGGAKHNTSTGHPAAISLIQVGVASSPPALQCTGHHPSLCPMRQIRPCPYDPLVEMR